MVKNFGAVFVINRNDRPERLDDFYREINRENVDWDIRRIEGIIEDPPDYYTCGSGAWGCLNSHLNILEMFKESTWENILVFEDDVKLTSAFNEKLDWFSFPRDWDFFYLGGQPLMQTVNVGPMVDKCCNINRTHAYALNRKALHRVYEEVSKLPNDHVDTIYGRLHLTMNAYIVNPRLCGQRSGYSDVANKKTMFNERFWR